MRAWFRSSPVRRWLLAGVLVAVGALAVILVEVGPRTEPGRTPHPPVAPKLPTSPVGRQMSWLIGALPRLPLSEREWQAHLSKEPSALPGASPAQINKVLQAGIDGQAVRLVGFSAVQPEALAATVRGHDGRELVVVVGVDGAGMITYLSLAPSAPGPPVTLPPPTGASAVGTDVVTLTDPARGGRRLMLTRWYPATSARGRPLAEYAGRRLTATLGLPQVRVHARIRAPARQGLLPVVLFSPGRGAPRIFYQALAEDLASHGYLVIATDHTGEAPVAFPGGDIQLPSTNRSSLAALSAIRVADMRVILRRLVLHRTSDTSNGPRPDPRHIAVIGHSLGGSTAAAVMRAEGRVDVGVDLDGSIVGSARRPGVARPFMFMTGRPGLDPTVREMFRHSSGPRLALRFAELDHAAFTDLPAIAPTALSPGESRSIRAIAVQRAYLRAFLDRYLLNRRSRLLSGPSRAWPEVTFQYRRRCCA